MDNTASPPEITPPQPSSQTAGDGDAAFIKRVQASWAITTLCLALEGWSREHGGRRVAVTIQGEAEGSRVRLALGAAEPEDTREHEASVFRHLAACERLRDLLGQIDHLRAFADQPRAAAALAEALVDAEDSARRLDPSGMLSATAPRSPLACRQDADA